MKTTVDIPDDLYSQARKLAAARGQQVASLITEGLQKLVVAQQPPHPGKIVKNGKPQPGGLTSKAAQWLAEWRALGQRKPAKASSAASAADVLSRMRR